MDSPLTERKQGTGFVITHPDHLLKLGRVWSARCVAGRNYASAGPLTVGGPHAGEGGRVPTPHRDVSTQWPTLPPKTSLQPSEDLLWVLGRAGQGVGLSPFSVVKTARSTLGEPLPLKLHGCL